MTWANPLALLCLFSIVALLLTRRLRPRRQVPVANLYLWAHDADAQQPSVATRLRRNRLLIVEVAVVAALCVALARPFFPIGRHDLAFVLDVSMSMGASDGSATTLDRAKTQMLDAVSRLPRSARVQLWLAGYEPRYLGEYSRGDAALADAIRQARVWDTRVDLDAAIRRTRSVENAPSRIYVWTDTQVTGRGSDVETFVVGSPADNAALTNIAVRRRLDDGSMELLVSAANYGQQPIQAELTVDNGRKEIARRPLSLAARATGALVFPLADDDGVITARLAVTDALAADNTRRLAVPASAGLRVLLLADSGYIRHALEQLDNVMLDSSPAAAPGANYDLVVCDRCTEIGLLGKATNLLAIPPPEAATRQPARVVLADGSHPIARALGGHMWIARPVLSSFLNTDAKVIARTADQPVVLASDTGSQRVVEVRVDVQDPAFAVEPEFPLLIANAVDWLSPFRDSAMTIVAGEPVRWIDDRERWITDTPTAGVYELPAGSSVRRFVVNPDVNAESDLSMTKPSREASSANLSVTRAEALYTEGTGWALFAALALLAVEWHLRTFRGSAR